MFVESNRPIRHIFTPLPRILILHGYEIWEGMCVNEYIYERAIEIGNYIAQTECTVRKAAKAFCVSKSTAHKDVSERLRTIDYRLYLRVKKILDRNFSVRHIRGGEATRQKYKLKKRSI